MFLKFLKYFEFTKVEYYLLGYFTLSGFGFGVWSCFEYDYPLWISPIFPALFALFFGFCLIAVYTGLVTKFGYFRFTYYLGILIWISIISNLTSDVINNLKNEDWFTAFLITFYMLLPLICLLLTQGVSRNDRDSLSSDSDESFQFNEQQRT